MAFAYSFTNNGGLSQNTVPTGVEPNGNSKGSWYIEGGLNLPIKIIEGLNVNATLGRQHNRHYNILDYNVYSVGLCYELSEKLGGFKISATYTGSNAKKQYYIVTNAAGKSLDSMRKRIWFGLHKSF